MGATVNTSTRPTRRAWRGNLVLSLVLLVAIAILGTAAASRHLHVRRDYSADGLYRMSDATKSIVGRLEDVVTVRLFATESVEHGELALRTARVRAQLEEILALRPETFELQTLDPTRSSEAARRAAEAGFRPQRSGRTGLGDAGGELVWLSVELTYRGRTERIAAPSPWRFETQFASALHALQKDRRIGVAWIGAPIEPSPDDPRHQLVSEADSTFRRFRSALEKRARLVPVRGLEYGRPVPEAVDVIFLVRPDAMHERAVYELDRFVQRGGNLVVCLDDPDYNLNTRHPNRGQDDFEVGPLGSMLRSWGIRVASGKQIWDADWQTPHWATVFDSAGQPSLNLLRSPMVITVPPEGFDSSLPPVQGLAGARFAWVHPVVPEALAPLPDGVERTDFIQSSPSSWLDDTIDVLPIDLRTLRTRLTVLRSREGRRHAIAAIFRGRFPSPWAGRTPPTPAKRPGFDAEPTDDVTPADVASTPGTVVVFGDADWLRDPGPPQKAKNGFLEDGGETLALNLVDWLTLDEELIGLRSRAPSLRPLRDFVEEEARALGVWEHDLYQTRSERRERDRKADIARARARRRQWWTMLAPAGVALLIVLGVGAFVYTRSSKVARENEQRRLGNGDGPQADSRAGGDVA